jgi:hypothetical protein
MPVTVHSQKENRARIFNGGVRDLNFDAENEKRSY